MPTSKTTLLYLNLYSAITLSFSLDTTRTLNVSYILTCVPSAFIASHWSSCRESVYQSVHRLFVLLYLYCSVYIVLCSVLCCCVVDGVTMRYPETEHKCKYYHCLTIDYSACCMLGVCYGVLHWFTHSCQREYSQDYTTNVGTGFALAISMPTCVASRVGTSLAR